MRLVRLCYSVHVITTMVPIISELIDRGVGMDVMGSYLVFLIVPVLLLIKSIWNSRLELKKRK
jgi:hypothetical protein